MTAYKYIVLFTYFSFIFRKDINSINTLELDNELKESKYIVEKSVSVSTYQLCKLINNASSCTIASSMSLNNQLMPSVRLLVMVINVRSLILAHLSVKQC